MEGEDGEPVAVIYDATGKELDRVPVEWVDGMWRMTREPATPVKEDWVIAWPDPPGGL